MTPMQIAVEMTLAAQDPHCHYRLSATDDSYSEILVLGCRSRTLLVVPVRCFTRDLAKTQPIASRLAELAGQPISLVQVILPPNFWESYTTWLERNSITSTEHKHMPQRPAFVRANP